MLYLQEVEADALRMAIDARQAFEVMRRDTETLSRRYRGTMRYGRRGDREYLLRRVPGSKSDTSLGPRSAETDAILARYTAEKAALQDRIGGTRARLEKGRRLVVAHGLGRVPVVAARLLRTFDDVGWLGARLILVGTNALFAYEARAGLRIGSGALSTRDIDVLHDARRRASFGGVDLPPNGFLGLLRKTDTSFDPVQRNAFRASDREGYLVDLVEPERGHVMTRKPSRLSDHPDDMEAIAIEGLSWLVNAPKFEAIAFDERGLPLRIATIDPRVFALHKMWLSRRGDREAAKRQRDRLQAQIAAAIARDHLGLDFDGTDLSALPARLRDLAADLEAGAPDPPLW